MKDLFIEDVDSFIHHSEKRDAVVRSFFLRATIIRRLLHKKRRTNRCATSGGDGIDSGFSMLMIRFIRMTRC